MRKIIFVVIHPFFQRDYHRFGIEYFMERGYSVEIWRLLSKKTIDFLADMPLYQGDNFHEYDYNELKKQLGNHWDDIYVIFSMEPEYYEIINRGYKYMLFFGMAGVFLLNAPPTEFFERVKRAFYRGFFQSMIVLYNKYKNINNKNLYINAMRKNPPIQILTSTHKVARIYLTEEQLQGNVLYTHAVDYDRYIEENRKRNDDTVKYIVFCDCGLGAIDYDSVLNNYEQLEDKSRFSGQIELLLSRLEEKYNLPAIILGHPHTKYENETLYGRKIVLNRTAEFTKEAVAFVLNTSTAISFAALYDVPTLYVVNTEFKRLRFFYPNLYELIEYEAKNVFGCGFLDMDDEEKMARPWDYVKRMDIEKRKQYIRDYLIDNNTKDKCSYEYLEEALRPIVFEE